MRPGDGPHFLHLHHTRCDLFLKPYIVLDKQHCWFKFKDKVFYLHTGKDIYIVEGFVPDVQMRRGYKAGGYKNLLFLTFGKILHVLYKLLAAEIEPAKHRYEKAFTKTSFSAEFV